MRYLLFVLLSFATTSFSEPWLSTRYAQNCAGCHAPGRENLVPKDRRCSLSCQGCHVNPNGGGMRSYYGKWNEDRWLSSTMVKKFKHENWVAPYKSQNYDVPGYPSLVELKGAPRSEKPYGRQGNEYKLIETRAQAKRIPTSDPYHLKTFSKIDGGGDIRLLSYQVDDQERKDFFMSMDLGLRYRPVYRYVNFVYEGRFLGSPASNISMESFDRIWGTEKTRNAYVLLNDMPYNLYAMAGYYRPLFGYVTPDHTQLSQKIMAQAVSGSGRSQTLVYKAVGVGGSPNVPYFAFNAIDGQLYTGANGVKDDTKGVVLSTGLRGVSFGWSFSYSLWASESKEKGVKTNMHALTGGGMVGRVVFNLEGLLVDRKAEDGFKANTFTVDTQTRLYKENYFLFQYGIAESLPKDLSSTQLQLGLRSFVIPGVDLSMVYDSIMRKDSNTSVYKWQTHLYF